MINTQLPLIVIINMITLLGQGGGNASPLSLLAFPFVSSEGPLDRSVNYEEITGIGREFPALAFIHGSLYSYSFTLQIYEKTKVQQYQKQLYDLLGLQDANLVPSILTPPLR